MIARVYHLRPGDMAELTLDQFVWLAEDLAALKRETEAVQR